MSKSSIDASEVLLDLVFTALDHGIDSVRGGGPLTPFVLSIEEGNKKLRRFVSEELSESVQHAMEFVSTLASNATTYAVAFDAYVTIEGQKFDAIMVEAGERDKNFGHRFAQRYRPSANNQPLEVIGNPAYMGQSKQLLV